MSSFRVVDFLRLDANILQFMILAAVDKYIFGGVVHLDGDGETKTTVRKQLELSLSLHVAPISVLDEDIKHIHARHE